LLNDFSDCTIGPSGASTLAIISRVELLPFEPVTAITGQRRVARWAAARSANAFLGYFTRTRARSANSAGRGGPPMPTMAPTAPRSNASDRNACPSVRVPGSATKSVPGRALRESISTERTRAPPPDPSSTPPLSCATPDTRKFVIQGLPPAFGPAE